MMKTLTKPFPRHWLRLSTTISRLNQSLLQSKHPSPTFNDSSSSSRSDLIATRMVNLCKHWKNKSCEQRRLFSETISEPYPKPTEPNLSSSNSSVPIDAGSSIRKPISLWPGMYHSPVTNALWEARSRMFEKPGDKPVDSVSQSELGTKTPSESRTTILYKFSSDFILREQYRNPWNEIRMGKLLEDLDALAGTISYKVPIFSDSCEF